MAMPMPMRMFAQFRVVVVSMTIRVTSVGAEPELCSKMAFQEIR